MNAIIINIVLIGLITIVGRIIGNFFDIPISYYMPIVIWFVALCLFNIFLEKQHVNIFNLFEKD
tara:strand:- start:6949 stop:7140 length:192 start_codon:yes stop_codon:yes gene_type:complete